MGDAEVWGICIGIIISIILLIIFAPYIAQGWMDYFESLNDEESEEEEDFSIRGSDSVTICPKEEYTLSWGFENAEDTDHISWEIDGPGSYSASGTGDDAEITISGSVLGEGKHDFTIEASYYSQEESFTTIVNVTDKCNDTSNTSDSPIPGFEPVIFGGCFTIFGGMVIYIFHRKFKKAAVPDKI